MQVSNLLVTLNSSVNLFIYCGFGKQFRKELKKLFHLNPENGHANVSFVRKKKNSRPDDQVSLQQMHTLRRYWRTDSQPGATETLILPKNNIGQSTLTLAACHCETTSSQLISPSIPLLTVPPRRIGVGKAGNNYSSASLQAEAAVIHSNHHHFLANTQGKYVINCKAFRYHYNQSPS